MTVNEDVGMVKRACVLILVLCVAFVCRDAQAEDRYYDVPFNQLKWVSGQATDTKIPGPRRPIPAQSHEQNMQDFLKPYAVGDAGEEIYIDKDAYESWQMAVANFHLLIRSESKMLPSGRLFVPNGDGAGLTAVPFTVTTDSRNQTEARYQFLKAREQYYCRLARSGYPGGAWFRHQWSDTRTQAGTFITSVLDALPEAAASIPDLADTFDLFTGSLAIRENLQLDRDLCVLSPADETIPINTIEQINTSQIDWKNLVQGLNPRKDSLASYVSADQHVVFFPSFQSMLDLMDEAKSRAMPLLRFFESRSEDACTGEYYARQLCISPDKMSRLFGPTLVTSVAFTGSDPYLRSGSDVAVLFEAANVEALKAALAARQSMAITQTAAAQAVSGTIEDIPYTGVVSPDRSLCSYLASMNSAVIVTNSLRLK